MGSGKLNFLENGSRENSIKEMTYRIDLEESNDVCTVTVRLIVIEK